MRARIICVLFCIVLFVLAAACSVNKTTETLSTDDLTINDVVNAFTNAGLDLEKDNSVQTNELAIEGIEPIAYKYDNDHFFIYVYETYDDRPGTHMQNPETEIFQDLYRNSGFQQLLLLWHAKNVIIIHTNQSDLDPTPVIANILFRDLNIGKELSFKGEGDYWEAQITYQYYEIWYKNNEGVKIYNRYIELGPTLHFKDPIKEIENLSYRYEYPCGASGGGNSYGNYPIREDGYIYSGYIIGYKEPIKENDIFTMTIKWNDQEESFELLTHSTESLNTNSADEFTEALKSKDYQVNEVSQEEGVNKDSFYKINEIGQVICADSDEIITEENFDPYKAYKVNKNGQTYGSASFAVSVETEPDLILALGVDGTLGYVYAKDLQGEMPKNPEEAIAMQKANAGKERVIPLYASDGKTIVGKFIIGPL